MIPLAFAVLLLNAHALLRVLHGSIGLDMALHAIGILLTLVFYLLIVFAYLRRSQARATSRSVPAAVAALAATAFPFFFPLLIRAGTDVGSSAVADGLLLVGLAWSLWSIRTLDRSLSVLAQARDLVSTGPYRLVRHPLYLGEITAALGIVLRGFTIPALVAWVALLALQAYRARTEEQLLSVNVTGYDSYRRRTSLLIPGVL